MPRKYTRRKKAVLPPVAIKQRGPRKPSAVAIDLADREWLIAALNNPIFVRAWNNAQLFKPSLMPSGLSGALGTQIANNRFYELRGWMMFESALLHQTDDPELKKEPPKDDYPDAGLQFPRSPAERPLR